MPEQSSRDYDNVPLNSIVREQLLGLRDLYHISESTLTYIQARGLATRQWWGGPLYTDSLPMYLGRTLTLYQARPLTI